MTIVGRMAFFLADKPTYVISSTQPEDTDVAWVDSGNGNLMKLYNAETGEWIPISAAYG